MTDAIEAGARAAIAAYNDVWNNWKELVAKNVDECREAAMRACIEAAIASGALVPASAVAEMRERCAARCDELGDEVMERAEAAHEEEEYGKYEELECAATEYSRAASAIRQLDISPASGEYVVVPRVPTDNMICSGDEEIIAALNDHGGVRRNPTPAHSCWNTMLNAASSNGDEE